MDFGLPFNGRTILVIWAPGGDNRPCQAPETLAVKGARRNYYLRQLAAALRKLQARLAGGEVSLEEYRQIKAEIVPDGDG